jgi:hypothetical protein
LQTKEKARRKVVFNGFFVFCFLESQVLENAEKRQQPGKKKERRRGDSKLMHARGCKKPVITSKSAREEEVTHSLSLQ